MNTIQKKCQSRWRLTTNSALGNKKQVSVKNNIQAETEDKLLTTKCTSNEGKQQQYLPAKSGIFADPEFIARSSEPIIHINVVHNQMASSKPITVVLLTGRKLNVLCNPETILAKDIFEIVIEQEISAESYLFGLAQLKGSEFLFIEHETKLYKISPPGWMTGSSVNVKDSVIDRTFTLYVRMKFFLETRWLQNETTRHLLYLQLRQDMLQDRIRCDVSTVLEMAAMALQAEFGDATRKGDYFQIEHYIPKWVTKVMKSEDGAEEKNLISWLHWRRKGESAQEAEAALLYIAETLQDYTYHFYIVLQDKKNEASGVCLGISWKMGIAVFDCGKMSEDRREMQRYDWSSIKRIDYDERYFFLTPSRPSLTGRSVKYRFYTPIGKQLYDLAAAQYQLFLELGSSSSNVSSESNVSCEGVTFGKGFSEHFTAVFAGKNLSLKNLITPLSSAIQTKKSTWTSSIFKLKSLTSWWRVNSPREQGSPVETDHVDVDYGKKQDGGQLALCTDGVYRAYPAVVVDIDDSECDWDLGSPLSQLNFESIDKISGVDDTSSSRAIISNNMQQPIVNCDKGCDPYQSANEDECGNFYFESGSAHLSPDVFDYPDGETDDTLWPQLEFNGGQGRQC